MSQFILQPFHRFTYVTAHSPTLPLLHLRHSSFSNPCFASPTSQALHLIHLASRPWRRLGITEIDGGLIIKLDPRTIGNMRLHEKNSITMVERLKFQLLWKWFSKSNLVRREKYRHFLNLSLFYLTLLINTWKIYKRWIKNTGSTAATWRWWVWELPAL